MGLLIDGFNLIYKFPELEQKMYAQKLNDARHGLLELLKAYHAAKPSDIRVVFDGKRNQGDSTERETVGPLRVFYSHDVNADTVIKNFIKTDENPHMTTVITSDKEIIFYGKRFQAPFIKSEDFAKHMLQTISDHETASVPEKPDAEMSAEELQDWKDFFKNGKK